MSRVVSEIFNVEKCREIGVSRPINAVTENRSYLQNGKAYYEQEI